MNDILERALKTFVQAFFGVLIPEAVLILSNVYQYDWANWQTFIIPLICAAIASGISAAWNAIKTKGDTTNGEG